MTSRLRSLRGEHGYSLVELLTVLVIMTVILTGLTALFIQGSNSELDMNRRFQAQQESRLALDKLRREVHCATSAATTPATGETPLVTLTLPAGCRTGTGSVSWCTVQAAGSTTRWRLYRKVGATCNATGSVRWADYLTVANIFTYSPAGVTSLARLRVRLPVDPKIGDPQPPYNLCDQIVLRNSTRSGSGGSLPTC